MTGSRCKDGLLELSLEEVSFNPFSNKGVFVTLANILPLLPQVGEGVDWVLEDRQEWIGSHPTVMDPSEQDNVYIGR